MNNENINSNSNELAYESEMVSASNLFDHAKHTASSGTVFSSARPDDGLVNIDGLQMTREMAQKLGVLGNEDSAPIRYKVEQADTYYSSQAEDNPSNPEKVAEESVELPEDNDPFEDAPTLSEEASSLLEAVTVRDGGAVTQAISEVFTSGDLSEETVNRLALAGGINAEAAHQTATEITESLNATIESATGIADATEMLRLASESSPNAVRLATMSAINGDNSNAIDIVKNTYQNLDTTNYRAELEHTLTEAGYKIHNTSGRLHVYGGDLGDQPVHWSVASANFDLTFTD